VGREQPAVGEPRETRRVTRLAETGEALGCGQNIRLGEHRLKLTLCLLDGELDRIRLRVRTEQMDRAIVDDGNDQLDLCLALARGKEVAQDLARRTGRRGGDRHLEPSESERVGAEIDLLDGHTRRLRRLVPRDDSVGGQTHCLLPQPRAGLRSGHPD